MRWQTPNKSGTLAVKTLNIEVKCILKTNHNNRCNLTLKPEQHPCGAMLYMTISPFLSEVLSRQYSRFFRHPRYHKWSNMLISCPNGELKTKPWKWAGKWWWNLLGCGNNIFSEFGRKILEIIWKPHILQKEKNNCGLKPLILNTGEF